MNKLYSNVSNPRGFMRKSNECLVSPFIKRTKTTSMIGFVLLFLLSIFGSINSTAQTVLINPAAEGGFELGPTFAANGWQVSNFTPVLPQIPNPWVISPLSNGSISGNAAIISSDGLTPSYSTTSTCTNYFYRDITVPVGQGKIKLDFNWLCGGESTWDMWQVFVAPTTITPVASAYAGNGASNVPAGIAGATFVGNGNLQAAAVQTATLYLPPSLAGTTFRLIFVWKSDTSAGVQPPAQLDNISLVSSVPGNFISIASGDWNAPATWDIGSEPSPLDNVIVSTGHTVTINAANQGANNLVVNGTLAYATVPTTFGVLGNLTVGSTGLVNVFEGTTGKTLTVAGNLINDGTINVSVGTGAAGTLTLNGSAPQTVSGTGLFLNDVIRNLIFSNTNTATPNINWSIDGIKIAQNLNLTGARINLGTNKLTFGNNAAGGTLTAPVGSGFLAGGKFSRWWTATVTGTGITAGAAPTGTASRYPFLSPTGIDRTMYVTRTNATGAVAGELSVVYNDATTITSDLNISDGTYAVNDRFNGNWVVSNEGTAMSSSSYRLAIYAPNTLIVSNGNSRIIGQNASIGGLHQNGTIIPVAQRIDVPQAALFAEPLYIGIASDDIPYTSITNGNWNAASTWNKGVQPSCIDPVVIAPGTTVTSAAFGNVASNVTIASGGTLLLTSGDLLVGCTLKNNPLVNNGTLTVSGGILNINGNLMNNAGSTLNQSGGEIVIDGNDGEVANSVPTATPLLRVTATTAANLNLTAGTITIINPHRGTSTISSAAVSIAQAGTPNASSADHTIRFGDGVSGISGGHTSGFLMNLFAGAFHYSIGNVEVDGATGTNRFLRTSGFIGILGNVTITSGEYQMASSTIVSGNILNNGTLTSTGLLGMGTFVPPNLINPATTPQSISGSGIFRNSLTTETANLNTFQVSNSSASGVTLNVPLSVSNNLTLTSGFLNTSNANLLTLGTLTAAGTLAVSDVNTTMIRGPFARTIAANNPATNFILFPVGKTAYSPISLAPTTTEVSVMRAEAFDTNAGTAGSGISNLSANRRWEAALDLGLFNDTSVILGDATMTNLSIPVQASSASGAYTAVFGSTATFTAGTPNVIQSNASINAADFTGFLSFAESNACVGTPAPGNTIASATTYCVGETIVLSLQNETVGSGVTYQWKSSPDGVTYTAIVDATAPTYTFTPTAGAFYQCDVTCASGPATATSTAVQVAPTNTVISTTPATRCGLGTLVLNATANTGATLNWYAGATGGAILGSGNSFTTPSITTTTDYFVSAATSTTATVTLGAGATVGTGVGTTFLPGGWGGAKTQYIIRASELAAIGISPGAISSLGFQATTSGQAYQGFVVEIGSTTQTVATTTFIASGLTQVYRGTETNDGFLPTANSANTLAFGTGTGSSNSFTWDGVSNIVVSFSWSSVPGAFNATGSGMAVDASAFTSTNWRQRDNLTPTAMQAETSASSTGTSRPRFFINGTVLCNSPRVAVQATVTPAPVLTVTPASTICNDEIKVLAVTSTTADFDTYVWSGNGLFTDAAATIPYVYPAAGSLVTVYFRSTTAGDTTITCNATNAVSSCAEVATSVQTVLPNATISASNPAICVSGTTILSLVPATGYGASIIQWQSSIDGVAYSDIAGQTGVTYTTPTLTSTSFYRAVVSKEAGSICSTPTFTVVVNNPVLLTTTPATRCGVGSVSLNATSSPGTTLNWYANPTGGVILASGSNFNTPSISATTTYYASAATSTTGIATLGAGATTGTGVGTTFLPGGWGGAKTQYIIRASELAAIGMAPGAISSLGFQATTSGQAYQGFVVEVGATTQTVANTTFISGLTQVYRGTGANDQFTPTANSVNTLAFGTGTGSATSFIWDGSSNIVVSFSWSSVPGAFNATGSGMAVDASAFTSTNWRQSDNVTPAVMQAETSASSTGTSRPRFLINGSVLCSSDRVAVAATVVTPPTITLSATNTTVCAGSPSTAVTITSGASDYDTFEWSPSEGVAGNATAGWTFSPTVNTTYTLTASQSTGALCSTIATPVVVSVNPVPTPLVLAQTPATICAGNTQELSVTGGSLSNVAIINENFNAATNNWTTINNTTNATDITIPAWTLRPSGFNQGTTFITNDASQFYLSNSDAAGSGNNTDTSLISPSFSTLNFTSASLSFNHFYQQWQTGTGTVSYSVNNGTWIDLQVFSANIGAANNFASTNIVLPAGALNQSDVRIRFRHFVTWGFYWAVNNVSVIGTQNTSVLWSPATNLFTDAAATVAYTAGTPATTVYFKPTVAGQNNITATASSPANCSVTATASLAVVDCGIPYANIQFPGTATITNCQSQTYFARVYKEGVTEAAGQGAGITAWIGRNTTNADPATWPESSWVLATFNVQSGNDDEYQATFGPSAVGTYYVASRFVFAPGAFVYGAFSPSGGGLWNGTNNVNALLTVTASPGPTASAQSFCNSGTVADLLATGTAIQWYTDATGGTALAGTTPLATGNYFASQTVDGCESARTSVAVTVNTTAEPTASAQTFCNTGTVANLVATGTGIQWYAAATGGSALASTTALATGTYYVSQTLNSCESARTMVAVTVNVTAAPTASAQTFCNSATVANLVATGTGLQWYAAATGGTALTSTTALATGTYYVSQTLAGCESARTMVAVTVNVTAAPTAAAQSFCNTGTVANLVASGTGIQWYAAATGGTALAGTTALATGNYFASQTVAGCESTRTMVAVTVTAVSAPTGTALQDFTTGQTLADFTVVGQNIIWYSSATGTTVLPSTTLLVSGTIYYASQTVNGCESVTRLAVTAGVDLRTSEFEIANLRYYPNPVQDMLTVDHSETIENVQMYNMLGQMVYNRNTNASKVTIEMTNMAAGNYILQVTVNGITKNVKVIKK